MLRTSIARATAASRIVRPTSLAFRPATAALLPSTTETKRCASAHAISNPTLADIEKRWENLPLQEQADLWMALRDRMKSPWGELTLQEKKAGMCFCPPLSVFQVSMLLVERRKSSIEAD